tara:strand:+ start:699 stop:1478 length:780 start_codon:yes stop_codon:yes gene_type:complete
MFIPIFIVNAFTNELGKGNPAAVCPLETWLPTETLQSIAAENNLSETAFFVKNERGYHLRWFTPSLEVDLCGHATLAAAFILFEKLGFKEEKIKFITRSGSLEVIRKDNLFFLNFPSYCGEVVTCPIHLQEGLGIAPISVIKGPNYLARYHSEVEVASIRPNMDVLHLLHPCGVIVTAPSSNSDFVSRYFAPSFGVPEDPVTGSAHCMLTPYWSAKLNKKQLKAEQISSRGGTLFCECDGDRVKIGGEAVLYLVGNILV